MAVINPRDFAINTVKHWEPNEAWAKATGATADIGLPDTETIYPSGIRNEVQTVGLEYITSKDYAEGLLAARRKGWDGIDYTDSRVAELKHRMHASIRHDKLLAEAKRNRVNAIKAAEYEKQNPTASDPDAWNLSSEAVGADRGAPANPAKLR